MRLFGLSVALVFLVASSISSAKSSQHPLSLSTYSRSFDPRLYPKKVTRCPALDRPEGKVRDIAIHYVDINSEADRTLILVHGWPGLWSTWSNQINHFQKEYHLIVPDLRGFGASTHPGDVQTSGTMADMVSDLACILQHSGFQHKVICVGHDWGAQVCWEAARMRPDLFGAVSGAVVPYISGAGPFMPIEQLSILLPHLAYMMYFEKQTHTAAQELNSDIRRTLRAVMRDVGSPPPSEFLTSSTSLLQAWKDASIPAIPFLTLEEEDYLVEQYSIQGFENTLQFYTHKNRLETWVFDRTQGNFSIPQPALYILPTNDPVADWNVASAALDSPSFFSQLSTHSINSAHWPQLEKPREFNRILQEWLDNIPQI